MGRVIEKSTWAIRRGIPFMKGNCYYVYCRQWGQAYWWDENNIRTKPSPIEAYRLKKMIKAAKNNIEILKEFQE